MEAHSESPTGASSTSMDAVWQKRGVLEVLLCAVTAIAYVGTLSYGFVYDDKAVIVENPVIRSWQLLGTKVAPSASNAVTSGATFYRPVTLAWLRLNYAAFGLSGWGWHFAMLAVHVLITYLMFALVRKLTGSQRSAALGALLFGLHPAHVENVAWLSSANDLLMTVFLVTSFLAFLRYRERKAILWMAVSCAFFGLALLSKETSAVFPILILAFAVIDPVSATVRPRRIDGAVRSGAVCIPYFLLLGLYLFVRTKTIHGLLEPIVQVSWATMLYTAPSILWFDLKQLLVPIHSSEFYAFSYVTKPDFATFVVPVVLLLAASLVTGIVIVRLRRRELAWFACIWTILTLLPTLYLRAIAPDNFVHDRFLYLPSVGIAILFAIVVEEFLLERSDTPRSVAVMRWGMAIVFLSCFVGTISHQLQWASNLLLYQNGLKFAPGNKVVQDNLANEFVGLGHFDKAIPLYLSALQHDPNFWLTNYNLGYASYKLGRLGDAENFLTRAIQIDGRDPDQFIFLARVQMQQGNLQEASRNAERALQRSPTSPGFHFVLAKIYEQAGHQAQAIKEYQAEIQAHPENATSRSELERLQKSP